MRLLNKSLVTIVLITFIMSLWASSFTAFAAEDLMMEPSINLLENGGFEKLDGQGNPEGWTAMGDWGAYGTISMGNAHSGDYALKITDGEGKAAWVSRWIYGLIPYAYYELTAYVKASNLASTTRGAGFKIEFYDPEKLPSGQGAAAVGGDVDLSKLIMENTNDLWVKVTATFQNSSSTAALLYCRTYVTGTVYYDDIDIRFSKGPEPFSFGTTDAFHYLEDEEGAAYVDLNNFYKDSATEMETTVDFSFLEGDSDKVLDEAKNVKFTDLKAEFKYQTSLLTEVKKKYTIKAVVKDGEGTEINKYERNVYKYPRPAAINEKGDYILDGKIFSPVIAYHVDKAHYDKMKEIGVNVVQMVATTNPDSIKENLDLLYAKGLMGLVCLYPGMKSAGHPDNVEITKKAVALVKDHPAVFAYAALDEPFGKGVTDEKIANAETAYKIIRDIDPVHPVYYVDGMSAGFQEDIKYSDVFCTDIYHQGDTRGVTRTIRIALDYANRRNKPIYQLGKTYKEPAPPLPSGEDVRSWSYRIFEEGAKGTGYYSISDAIGQYPGQTRTPLFETDTWEPMVQYSKDELPRLITYFVYGENQTFFKYSDDKEEGGGLYAAAWVEDNDLILIAQNRDNEDASFDIPLVSSNGLVKIDKYEVELIAGTAKETISDGKITLEIPKQMPVMYKIIPQSTPDYSKLAVAHFTSLVETAESTLNSATDFIGNQHWKAQINMITEKLRIVKEELKSTSPNMKKVMDDTANMLSDLEHLKEWVYRQSDIENKKEDLINVLNHAGESIGNIMKSLIVLDVEIGDTKIVAGEQIHFDVKVQNNGSQDITNVGLTFKFPKELGIQNDVKTISRIRQGEIIQESFSYIVPAGAPIGSYDINLDFNYVHHNALVSSSHSEKLDIANIVDTSITPVEITTTNDSSKNLTLKIVNNAASPVDAALNIETPEGMSTDILKQVTLGPDEVRYIEGILQLSDTLLDGSYEVWIVTKVNGEIISRLPLRVKIDNNLAYNSGFEEDINNDSVPDGWLLRNGAWVQDEKRSGNYSVSLKPDANNTWNVINTHTSKRITVVPGTTYRMKIWAKNSSTEGGVFIGYRESNSSGVTLKYYWVEVQKNSDWTQYELKFTPTANTKYIEVFMRADQKVNGQAWFDDLYIEK